MNNKKNQRWYIALSPELHDRAVAFAIKTNRTVGKAAEWALRQELERFEKFEKEGKV